VAAPGLIVLQVLDALAELHEESVIHGDIQPENVIVQQTTLGQDYAKVIDLGFASARGCSRLTLAPEPPSEIHGTSGFIAPERLAGLEPDARADLYSVGAMMYFLLTTRPVPDISLAPDELGIPAPSIMAPGARIPLAIDAIVMRALSDVDDRFPNAAAMAGALRDALAQPEAPPAVTAPESQPEPRRRAGAATCSGARPRPCCRSPTTWASLHRHRRSPVSIDDQAPVEADEEQPEDRSPMMLVSPAGSPGDLPHGRRTSPALCIGVLLCFAAIGALWRVGAALDGPLVAEQAMNTAPSQETSSATVPRPAPDRPPAPALLPPTPPEPIYKPVTTPKISNNVGDSRVTRVRREIRRCKPLLPFSKSKVTVEADTDGQTQILFGGRTADGEFGRCVGKVAARTRVARDERLSFNL
jgi:serine/threonine protein kinase